MKTDRLTAILMAGIMAITMFPVATNAEEGDSLAEDGHHMAGDCFHGEENDSPAVDGNDPAEDGFADGDGAFSANGDAFSADESGPQTRSYSCPNNSNTTHNYTTAKSKHLVDTDLTVSFSMKFQENVVDAYGSVWAELHGEFEKRPLLGDRVRSQIKNMPNTVHGESYIHSTPAYGASGHVSSGTGTSPWASLNNDRKCTFSAMAFYS